MNRRQTGSLATVGVTAIAMVMGVVSTSAVAGDNEYLVNEGFELIEDTVGFLPDDYGNWQGDLSEIVSSTEYGIVPFEGVEMLEFKATRMTGPGFGSVGGEVWQLIDISSFENQVRSGWAVLNASAYFNRVDRYGEGGGDQMTDTRFSITLAAYSGSTADFSDMWLSGSHLAMARTDLFSDDDAESWEQAMVQLFLPKNTDFIAIRLAAIENVMDDGDYPEFDGHYADGTALWLIPAPSSAALLCAGCGLVGGGWPRRRRSPA